jgi:hypothetical protein
MLSLQEISDRLEIADLLTLYSDALDRRDWDQLDQVFLPEAVLDSSEMGGVRAAFPEAKAYMMNALPVFPVYQHLTGPSKIAVDRDLATARTILFNPTVAETEGRQTVFFAGAWYRDRLVRAKAGWRIAERYLEKAYFHNLPAGLGGAAETAAQ